MLRFEQWHSTKFHRALLLCLLGCSNHMLLTAMFAVLGFNILMEKVLALEDNCKEDNCYYVTGNPHNAHAWTSWNCLPWFWESKGDGCIAKTCIVNLYFYPNWITTMTSLFPFQHMPTTSSCDYLSLSMLLNFSNDANIMFTVMIH